MFAREEEGEDQKCPVCGKMFARRDSLKRHIATHNPEGANVYACDVCGEVTSRKDNMVRHLSTHQRQRGGAIQTRAMRKRHLPTDSDEVTNSSVLVKKLPKRTPPSPLLTLSPPPQPPPLLPPSPPPPQSPPLPQVITPPLQVTTPASPHTSQQHSQPLSPTHPPPSDTDNAAVTPVDRSRRIGHSP